MRFHQHVYGRVAKGYHEGYPGYQLAALSNDLADHPELVDQLNRLSFFNLRGGRGDEVRYSFYRPVRGFLAFGCSRLARDQTGSVGAFAHHLVCEESEYIDSSVSPASVLQSSHFYENEAKLPPNRSLPCCEFRSADAAGASGGQYRSLALQIVNIYLDRSEQAKPLIVAPDEPWEILAELFGLLPQLEASYLSFSTLFIEASAFLSRFQLVCVPERKHIPVEVYSYRIIEPNQTQSETVGPRSVPLSSLWQAHPEQASVFLRFVHILRHRTGQLDEAVAVLPGLLALGTIFRDCVESLQIPRIFNLILTRVDWIVAYKQAGVDLVYEDMIETIWESSDAPRNFLVPLLTAVPQLKQPGLGDVLLTDLAERTASGLVDVGLIGDLPTPETRGRFYRLATDRLEMSQQQELARRLRNEPFYRNEIHDSVAGQVVRLLVDGAPGWVEPAEWLDSEVDALGSDSFARAVRDLAVWVSQRGWRDFRMAVYRIDRRQYLDLLQAAWSAGTRLVDLDRLDAHLWRSDYGDDYFSFLVDHLRRSSFSTQKDILRILAARYRPSAAQSGLFSVIRHAKDASRLARHFRTHLENHNTLDEFAHRALEAIERRSRWRPW